MYTYNNLKCIIIYVEEIYNSKFNNYHKYLFLYCWMCSIHNVCMFMFPGRGEEAQGETWEGQPGTKVCLARPPVYHHPPIPDRQEWQVRLLTHVSECVAGLQTRGQQGALVRGEVVIIAVCCKHTTDDPIGLTLWDVVVIIAVCCKHTTDDTIGLRWGCDYSPLL